MRATTELQALKSQSTISSRSGTTQSQARTWKTRVTFNGKPVTDEQRFRNGMERTPRIPQVFFVALMFSFHFSFFVFHCFMFSFFRHLNVLDGIHDLAWWSFLVSAVCPCRQSVGLFVFLDFHFFYPPPFSALIFGRRALTWVKQRVAYLHAGLMWLLF